MQEIIKPSSKEINTKIRKLQSLQTAFPEQLLQIPKQSTTRIYYFDQQIKIQEQPQIKFPLTRKIIDSFSNAMMINSKISDTAKHTNNFFQNGRQIYNKKKETFYNFINQDQFMKQTYESLNPTLKEIFRFTVMTISNLFLKLSISSTKSGIIFLDKLPFPQFLNIFLTSLLFQQYMTRRLIQTQQEDAIKRNIQFNIEHKVSRVPKIALIKISKLHNSYDSRYIDLCLQKYKQLLKNNNIQKTINHLKFYQIYQNSYEQDTLQQWKSSFKKVNMRCQFEKNQFNYDNYLLIYFNQLIIPQLQKFQPDSIIFIDDDDAQNKLILAQTKGAIVNSLSQKVQQKIFVCKEWSLPQNLIQKYNPNQMINQNNTSQIFKSLKSTNFSVQTASSLRKTIQETIRCDFQSFLIVSQNLKKQMINKYKLLRFIKPHQTIENYQIPQLINTYQQINKHSLNYCLALSMKFNFDEVKQKYNNYKYQRNIIKNISAKIQNYIKAHKQQTNSSQKIAKYSKNLQSIRNLPINQHKEKYLKSIINLQKQKQQLLLQNKPSILITQNQTYYIHYTQNSSLFLFVFGQKLFSIYRKRKTDIFFDCINQIPINQNNKFLTIKNSTIIATDNYLYKAFGQHQNLQNQKSIKLNAIYRLSISHLQNPQKGSKNINWQIFKEQCFMSAANSHKVTVPLQYKKNGWAFKSTINKKTIVIFGGGYNYKCYNEERINKNFYVLNESTQRLYKYGKINPKIISNDQNVKKNNLIFPFIYGFPLTIQKSKNNSNNNSFMVLNTNGYTQNVNRFKKLYLTQIYSQFKQQQILTTISSQNQQYAQKQQKFKSFQPQIAIQNKKMILQILSQNYNKINRFQNTIALTTNQGQHFILKITPTTNSIVEKNDAFDIIHLQTAQQYIDQIKSTDEIVIAFKRKPLIKSY